MSFYLETRALLSRHCPEFTKGAYKMTALYCHISQRFFRKIDTQQPPKKRKFPFDYPGEVLVQSGARFDFASFCAQVVFGWKVCENMSGVCFRLDCVSGCQMCSIEIWLIGVLFWVRLCSVFRNVMGVFDRKYSALKHFNVFFYWK